MNGELDAKEWLKRVPRDIRAARELLAGALYEESAFHSQQAIEKALKAVYIGRFDELRKVHDLTLLGKRVSLPQELLVKCAKINSYYVETRYPGTGEVVSKEEAKDAISAAREVLRWAQKNI